MADHNRNYAKFDEAVDLITKDFIDRGYDSNGECDVNEAGRNLAAGTGFTPGGLRAVIEQLREL